MNRTSAGGLHFVRRHFRAWLGWIPAGLLGASILANAQQIVPAPSPSAPAAPSASVLSSMPRVYVREFRFEGNTVFSARELAGVVAAYTGREITSEELEEARRAVTQHYISRGYINSGAVLPEQQVRAGTVTVRIVEGKLTEIEVSGNRWLRSGYVSERVRDRAGPPLNLDRLKDGLQWLRENPNVQQVNAELRPGALPGESSLDVRLLDRPPFRLGLQVDNHRPPSVDSEEILVLTGDSNLTGHGDPLEFTYGIGHWGVDDFRFSGAGNLGGSYAVPLNARDTTLRVHGSKSDYAIVEEPFAALDIRSETERYGVTLRQPLYRAAGRELAVAVMFERLHSETSLLGTPFTITPGAVHGRTDISALRFIQEWTDRRLNQVLAARSTFNVGIDAFGVTDDGTDRNAKFFSWLGQVEYARRLFDTPCQILLRTDVLWTGDPLLSTEQLTIGGASTVRGYRENQLVRDRGVVCSAELRVPLLADRAGNPVVQAAPFFDFGGGWNVHAATPDPRTISSVGIGVILTPGKHLNAQLYWGHPLRHVDTPGNDPQDLGLHFQVTADAF